jgi:hypothetical protein
MQAYEICKKPAAMHDSASGLRITENGAVKGLRNRSFLKRSAALPPRANPTNKLAGLDMRVTCLPPKPNELANQPCITVARKWWWAWVGQPGEEQDNMIDRSSRADFQPMTTIISPCDSTICFIFRKFGQDVSTWMSTPCIRGSAKDLRQCCLASLPALFQWQCCTSFNCKIALWCLAGSLSKLRRSCK